MLVFFIAKVIIMCYSNNRQSLPHLVVTMSPLNVGLLLTVIDTLVRGTILLRISHKTRQPGEPPKSRALIQVLGMLFLVIMLATGLSLSTAHHFGQGVEDVGIGIWITVLIIGNWRTATGRSKLRP